MGESVNRPLPIPVDIKPYNQVLPSLQVEELDLLPVNRWNEKFHPHWEPGENGRYYEMGTIYR